MSRLNFCHITPTAYLDEFAKPRTHHLLLAHLIERDAKYREWYMSNKLNAEKPQTYILDNSAFEMYKEGKPMYPSERLIELGKAVNADYIVMSDYPGEPYTKTIAAAMHLAPKIRAEGFGTFYCPQSEVGKIDDLSKSFNFAAVYPLIDYIGVSILAIPNAYGVEKGNKLQRYLSRMKFLELLNNRGIIETARYNNKKFHLLGMTDGPNEISLLESYLPYIDTWDSSAAVWTGLNGISFDNSPTGLINGKFELPVDFNHNTATAADIALAERNIRYIEDLIDEHYFM